MYTSMKTKTYEFYPEIIFSNLDSPQNFKFHPAAALIWKPYFASSSSLIFLNAPPPEGGLGEEAFLVPLPGPEKVF